MESSSAATAAPNPCRYTAEVYPLKEEVKDAHFTHQMVFQVYNRSTKMATVRYPVPLSRDGWHCAFLGKVLPTSGRHAFWGARGRGLALSTFGGFLCCTFCGPGPFQASE